ncbi:hypothetical protein MPER_07463, partial [Moniliophthora perniciosa FA553]
LSQLLGKRQVISDSEAMEVSRARVAWHWRSGKPGLEMLDPCNISLPLSSTESLQEQRHTTPGRTSTTKRKPTIDQSWEAVLKAVGRYDDDMVKNWRDDIDTLLVFAGLFSAVVTAFAVESYKWLSEDANDTTRGQRLQQIRRPFVSTVFGSSALSLASHLHCSDYYASSGFESTSETANANPRRGFGITPVASRKLREMGRTIVVISATHSPRGGVVIILCRSFGPPVESTSHSICILLYCHHAQHWAVLCHDISSNFDSTSETRETVGGYLECRLSQAGLSLYMPLQVAASVGRVPSLEKTFTSTPQVPIHAPFFVTPSGKLVLPHTISGV